MRTSDSIGCADFPCTGVNHDCYIVPDVDIDPHGVSMVMISEAAPADTSDYYYAGGDPLFAQTTVQAFSDAGASVPSSAAKSVTASKPARSSNAHSSWSKNSPCSQT
jgi:hypothetical protein